MKFILSESFIFIHCSTPKNLRNEGMLFNYRIKLRTERRRQFDARNETCAKWMTGRFTQLTSKGKLSTVKMSKRKNVEIWKCKKAWTFRNGRRKIKVESAWKIVNKDVIERRLMFDNVLVIWLIWYPTMRGDNNSHEAGVNKTTNRARSHK